MSIVIGIDAGISSTKIIGIENGKRIMTPMSITGNNNVASIYGILSAYLVENQASYSDVEHVMLTGIGAQDITTMVNDCPFTYIDEFKANGIGAKFDTGLDRFIVVSMGTGTSLVRVDGDEVSHIGGIAMGGGTLQGLSQLLLNTSNIEMVDGFATLGFPDHVNLSIMDVSKKDYGSLFSEATASLFGKVVQSNFISRDDIAAGLVHMVLETIGSCAVLSQMNGGFKDFVLIGRLTELYLCKSIFPKLEQLYGVHFHIPKFAPYCTALGAVLSYQQETE